MTTLPLAPPDPGTMISGPYGTGHLSVSLPPPEPGTRQLDADRHFFVRHNAVEAIMAEPVPFNVRALFVFMVFGFWCWVGLVFGFLAGRIMGAPPAIVTSSAPYVGADHLERGLMAAVALAAVGVIGVLVGRHQEAES